MAQKPFCGDTVTFPLLATLFLQTPRSQECAFWTSTSQKYLPELTWSWPSTQGRETNLSGELGRSWHGSSQVILLPSSDKKSAEWAVAASRVRFTAKTRDHPVSGKSLSRLGPESYENSSGSGEIQFTSLDLPWDYPQGTGSVLDHDRLTNLELFFSPICKEQMNIRIHNLTELPVCPEYCGNKLLNSRIMTTKNKTKHLFSYTWTSFYKILNYVWLEDLCQPYALLIQNSYRIHICNLFRVFGRKYRIWCVWQIFYYSLSIPQILADDNHFTYFQNIMLYAIKNNKTTKM